MVDNRETLQMYCILVAGMPASGKSSIAKAIGEKWNLPVISKDSIKELLFDNVGFQSRAEKVNLGTAAMEIMYYTAEQLMKAKQPFILENNFEYSSEHGIKTLLNRYHYFALTISLTGDYRTIYRRFRERDLSPDRHRGHVVNDCFPEKKEHSPEEINAACISFEDYVNSIEQRGFDNFFVGNKRIRVDTTDFSKTDLEKLFLLIASWETEISKKEE